MSSPTNPTKKQRALPRVWARFLSLKTSHTFTYKGERYYKSIFPCMAIHLCLTHRSKSPFVEVHIKGSKVFFAPWTRVQTDILVRDAIPGGKSSRGFFTPWFKESTPTKSEVIIHPGPYEENGLNNCAAGHQAMPSNVDGRDNTAIGVIQQPTSDNNVSGPTS